MSILSVIFDPIFEILPGFLVSARTSKRSEAEIFESLGIDLNADIQEDKISGVYKGLRYECYFKDLDPEYTKTFILRVLTTNSEKMVISSKKHTKTVDSEHNYDPGYLTSGFFKKFAVNADNLAYADSFLADKKRQKHLKKLFSKCAGRILFLPDAIEVETRYFLRFSLPGAMTIRRIISHIAEIIK